MAGKGAKVTKDNVNGMLKALNALTRKQVLVGIPAEKAPRQPDPGAKAAPINNAGIGYINEFGLPEKNIPARPHLVPGVQQALPKIMPHLQKAAAVAFDSPLLVDDSLNAAGLIAQASVRAYMTVTQFVPLAPRTLADRRRKGFAGTKPLLVTGQYRNAMNYTIRVKGQK